MCPRPGMTADSAAANQGFFGSGRALQVAPPCRGDAPQFRQAAPGPARTPPQRPQRTSAAMDNAILPKCYLGQTVDLQFSAEENAFRDEVRAWLDANLPPEWRLRGVGGYRDDDDE